jgi:hypothetical protein
MYKTGTESSETTYLKPVGGGRCSGANKANDSTDQIFKELMRNFVKLTAGN